MHRDLGRVVKQYHTTVGSADAVADDIVRYSAVLPVADIGRPQSGAPSSSPQVKRGSKRHVAHRWAKQGYGPLQDRLHYGATSFDLPACGTNRQEMEIC